VGARAEARNPKGKGAGPRKVGGDSLENGDDEQAVDKAWEEEVAKGSQEVDKGKAEFVEWSTVKAEIARRLGEK
jgi:hypothetical protein